MKKQIQIKGQYALAILVDGGIVCTGCVFVCVYFTKAMVYHPTKQPPASALFQRQVTILQDVNLSTLAIVPAPCHAEDWYVHSSEKPEDTLNKIVILVL